jgi:DNA repair protein RecN (Recombination protein N)
MSLRDFVIVESLEMDFATGYTTLTGETGAGKSILIDALQLALGERAQSSAVRDGAQRCDISVAFHPSQAAIEWLSQAGFQAEDALILRRSIDRDGKSRAWINGSLSPLSQLRELASFLVDIHGQHAWQGLTQAATIRRILDHFAHQDTSALSENWQRWHQAKQTLIQARENINQLQERREALEWRISEVEKLDPKEDEWDTLNTQHQRLGHTQTLLEQAHKALHLLEGDDTSVCTRLHRIQNLLGAHAHIEPLFADISQNLNSALALLEDSSRTLGHYQGKTEVDELGFQKLDERLSLWMSLARRYRLLPEELPVELNRWRQELIDIEGSVNLHKLEQTVSQHYESYLEAARTISSARKKAAPRLAKTITSLMQELGMPGGVFTVNLVEESAPTSYGLENVEFLVAGHAGVEPKPIAKVASGGELSRIALAIAVTTSQMGQAPTLIFDEVDSGIGGATAITVGKLLRQLASARQVLAVTHLPQVAAHAHHHLLVSKDWHENRTLSTIEALNAEGRVQELARMLGGSLTPTTLQHAQEMLDAANP